ncbi:MAG: alanine--tRNA ligase-related protein, partial [Minisyncoccia bacterium]
VLPSNTDQGYVLRRLLRRVVLNADRLNIMNQELGYLATQGVVNSYTSAYPELNDMRSVIHDVVMTEENKFRETLKSGLKEFEKGTDPFVLFTTYGFPFELTKELAMEKGIEIDEKDFQEKFKSHQDLSRSGAEQKFKGGLADTSEMSIKYHTATHLLHQALKDVLGNGVEQKGSNITPERLRFDFSHTAKVTAEELKRVEEIINQKILEALPVQNVILPKEEALKLGARHLFSEKYGDEVSVYFIGQDLQNAYSKEFCGGPHVTNTYQLGHFKILKEEAVAQGIRRIKAVLE